MKIVRSAVVGGMAGVVVLLGFYYFFSHSLDRRVDQQEVELGRVSRQAEEQSRGLAHQGTLLRSIEKDIRRHSEQIDSLQRRLGEAETKIRVTEEEIAVVRASSGEDRERLVKLEFTLNQLREGQEKRARVFKALRKQQLFRAEAFDRRLEALEKRLGVSSGSLIEN